jgi:hypothetical protein
MPVLDYREITRPDKGSSAGLQDSFELFARDFLRLSGMTIIEDPSRGSDGGKDLIAVESREGPWGTSTVRWLVTCKHKAASGDSVKPGDEVDLHTRLKRFDCNGLLAVYSTLPSSGLTDIFSWLREKERFEVLVLDKEALETKLLGSREFQSLAQRYFPKSMAVWEIAERPFLKAHLDSHDLTALAGFRDSAPLEFQTLRTLLVDNDVQLFVSPYVWARLFAETKGAALGLDRFQKKRAIVRQLDVKQHPRPSDMVAKDLFNVSADPTESFSSFSRRFRENEVKAFVAFVLRKYRNAYAIERFVDEVVGVFNSTDDERAQISALVTQEQATAPFSPPGSAEAVVLLELVTTYEASEQLALTFLRQSFDAFETNKAKMYSNLQVDNLANSGRHTKSRLSAFSNRSSFDTAAYAILLDVAGQWDMQFALKGPDDLKSKLPHIRAILGFHFGLTSGFRRVKVSSNKPKQRKAELLKQSYAMSQLTYAPDCDVFSCDEDFVKRLQHGVQGVSAVRSGGSFWRTLLDKLSEKTGNSYGSLIAGLGRCYSR